MTRKTDPGNARVHSAFTAGAIAALKEQPYKPEGNTHFYHAGWKWGVEQLRQSRNRGK